MGLQEILLKIEQETEQRKKEILEQAEKERERIIAEAKKKAEEIIDKAKEEKDKLVKQKVNALVADYVIQWNIEITKAKREILEEIYNSVLEKIRKDPNLYREVINYLFEVLPLKGDEEIYIGEDEKVINEEFIRELNNRKGTNLKLAQKRVNLRGGFLAVGKMTNVDASLGKFMEIVRDETEVHVSKILFG